MFPHTAGGVQFLFECPHFGTLRSSTKRIPSPRAQSISATRVSSVPTARGRLGNDRSVLYPAYRYRGPYDLYVIATQYSLIN